MNEFFIRALQLILSLSILVILHEFGHFIPAKIFKTKVEKFFLFFDVKFSLFKKKIGDTIFGIGWLPLGGYVKISGMVDESMDTKQLESEPKPWEFRSKPAWQRLIIMFGGVFVNFVLAFVIYILCFFTWGEKAFNPSSFRGEYMVAKEMEVFGFQNGDKILEIDGDEPDYLGINKNLILRSVSEVKVLHSTGDVEHIKLPDTLGHYILNQGFYPLSPKLTPRIASVEKGFPAENSNLSEGAVIKKINGQEVSTITDVGSILRELDLDTVMIESEKKSILKTDQLVLGKDKVIGVTWDSITTNEYSFLESISKGISLGYWTIYEYIAQLKYIFTSKKGITGIGGFASIGKLFSPLWDWQDFWQKTAFLSIMLAVLNLLPIPALDGGHIIFLLYEIVTRRKPKQKVLEVAQMIGVFILLALVLYANGNDLYRYLIN